MATGTLSSTSTVWRLAHMNGQTASCAVVPAGGRYRVECWLNTFIASAQEVSTAENAYQHAASIKRDLERRGFREDC